MTKPRHCCRSVLLSSTWLRLFPLFSTAIVHLYIRIYIRALIHRLYLLILPAASTADRKMPRITFPSKKNVWQTICAEYEEVANIESLDGDIIMPATMFMPANSSESAEYDGANLSPVLCGYSFALSRVDDDRLLVSAIRMRSS